MSNTYINMRIAAAITMIEMCSASAKELQTSTSLLYF